MKAKRKEALLVNETYYFTDKPCKKGHVAPRRTINGFCTTCEKDKNNSEARKQYMVDYAEKNREKIRQIANNWQKNNKGKVNANTAIRHSRKMQRRPSWLTKEDKEYIRCLYQLSAMLNRETNTQWHVDHIVPLQGEMVSGLHVPWNLRAIPAKENMVKGNKYNG